MLYRAIEILIAMILLIPVFAVLNKVRLQSTKQTAFYFLFAAYLSAVCLFVGLPTLQFMRVDFSLTLIPFLPMISDFQNTVLNIVLFVPLGILLPFLWQKYGTLKATSMFGFCMSLSIEILQIFTYRATDINDIIANTLGTALGYFLFRITARVIPPAAKFAEKKNDAAVILLPVSLVMFFIHPYIAALFYRFT